MTSLRRRARHVHANRYTILFCLGVAASCFVLGSALAKPPVKEAAGANKAKAKKPAAAKELAEVPVKNANAKTAGEMKPYTELIPNSEAKCEMVPIPGGKFLMGSPDEEEDRGDDEGPQFTVEIEPFWMGKHEVTWDEYETFMMCMDIKRRKYNKIAPTSLELKADAVSRPTKPYTDMTFGMGKEGYPAICMTQLAARMYCKWLSAKTGRYYRLPTEAEWEYACRAGTKTAYSFGDDPDDLEDYAWSFDNSDDKYQKVGKKKPNPWGLHDMHGNVSEWVLDQYFENRYSKFKGKTATKTLAIPTKLYPRIVRGGSWDDDPETLRSAARIYSSDEWKQQDPQFPQSIWYHTDAVHVGFRVVRPLRRPTAEEDKSYWDAGTMMPKRIPQGKVGCNEE